MVCASAEEKTHNIFEGLREGYITRGDLQYCAENILNYILKSPTFKKYVDGGCKKPDFVTINDQDFTIVSSFENIESGKDYIFDYNPDKKCVFVFETECLTDSLAQYPIILTVGGKPCVSLSISGNDSGRIIRQNSLKDTNNVFRFEFSKQVKINKFMIKQ